MNRLGTSVRGTVIYISSDNLGAHSFAGFQESFNVDKFCRFCLAGRKDIQTCSVRSGAFVLAIFILEPATWPMHLTTRKYGRLNKELVQSDHREKHRLV